MTHSFSDVAEQLGVSIRTIHEWITQGELRAINVSRSRASRKPRLRVLDSDLKTFLAGREVGADPPNSRRRRRLKSSKQYV